MTCPSDIPRAELRIKSGGAIASAKVTASVLRSAQIFSIPFLNDVEVSEFCKYPPREK